MNLSQPSTNDGDDAAIIKADEHRTIGSANASAIGPTNRFTTGFFE